MVRKANVLVYLSENRQINLAQRLQPQKVNNGNYLQNAPTNKLLIMRISYNFSKFLLVSQAPNTIVWHSTAF